MLLILFEGPAIHLKSHLISDLRLGENEIGINCNDIIAIKHGGVVEMNREWDTPRK